MLGVPTVLLEIDPLADSVAIDRALDKYDEFFTIWQYVTINVTQAQRTYNLVVPATTQTYTNVNIGTISSGQVTTTLTKLTGLPINKGSVGVTIGSVTGTDNGVGQIIGTGIASGTINYVTGQLKITLSSAVGSNTDILVTYDMLLKEELAVKDIVGVQQINPQVVSYWSAFGLLEIPSLEIGKILEMPADYYKSLSSLSDANKLTGKELTYEYYNNTLFLQSFLDGVISVKCVIEPRLEDIPDSHTSLFTDLVQGYLKQILGEIRRKYNNIQVPGGEISLNGEALVSEGKEEVTAVVEKFNRMQSPGFFVVM